MLTGKQRGILRALGNGLKPIVIIGKNGVTDKVSFQLEEALTARELVKGRVLPHPDFETKEVAEQLAKRTGAEVIQVIGRNILFYRAPQDGTPSKIEWERKC